MDVNDVVSEDDDITVSPRRNGRQSTSSETASQSNSMKRGLKLKDQSDTISLSGAIKKGFRKHGMKSGESMQNLANDVTSPRHSKKFSFRSPMKPKRSHHNNDDAISLRSMKSSRDSTYHRENQLRVDDVVQPSTYFDDSVSVIGGLVVDTAPIKQEEGIRDTIGRKNVVTLKKMVKLERPQGDGVDPKVLVLTPYRCQILGIKAPFKLQSEFHFLDIKSMDSPSPERLHISTNQGKIFFMIMIGTDDADHIIGRVALSLRTIFPNVALSRILKASLEPLGRQKVIQSMLNQADQAEPGPCGNFSEMYRCICDYLGVPVREDVEWDVDTIYLSQNCKEINLKDFDLPEARDIIPIISVMIYNRWFEGLVVRGSKLTSEVLDFILKVTRKSYNLKELVLDGVGIKGDFAQKLSNNLIENKEAKLRVLDLSNNPLEDKGLLHLSGALPVIRNVGIEKLSLSRAGLTSKGVNGLCQSLRSSPNIIKSLTHLSLSGNSIRSDDAEGLYSFLSNENHLTSLDLSSTDCSVEVFVSALSKGCTQKLQTVYIGKNHFYNKKNKDSTLPPSFQEFFEKTTALVLMDLSSMRVPPEALRCIFEGLLGNRTSGLEVSLNLASCELKSVGCQVIKSNISSLTNLTKLDITDNSLDNDMIDLLGWLQQNKSLKELKIGRNFFGVKSKNMRQLMEAFVELVQEEESCLESLSLADSKIREFIHILLGCLGSNTSLTSLDISGNFMGDGGSRVLAKSLQINSKLKILKLDRNSLSAVGFHEIANALEKNYTLRYMPYPVNDAVATMKHHPERTQNALARIQDLLLRNANENRASNDQQFRLQKVVTNTAQQVLDKVAEKVDDVINALEILDADSASNDIVVSAKNLVKDANNSKQLLSDIYGLGMEKTAGDESQLQCKINEMASGMEEMVDKHLKNTVAAMTKNAEAQCPHMFEDIKEDIYGSVDERCRLPPHYVKDHIVSSSGTEIVNKVSELNLAIATLISDKVTDTLLAALSQSNIALTEQLNKYKHQQKVGSNSTPSDLSEEVEDEGGNPESQSNIIITDEHGKKKSPTDLPTMRRERAQSVAKRRQRPTASAPHYDEGNRKSPRFESRVVSEEVQITEFGPEDEKEEKKEEKSEEMEEDKRKKPDKKTSKREKKNKSLKEPEAMETVDGAGEFPEVQVEKKLDHVTKGRPRGPTRRQRRPPRRPRDVAEEQNVDDFFQNNVSNTDFTETLTKEEEEEVKRKERLEGKKISKKMPAMPGMMVVTPGMLKGKSKTEEESPAQEVKKEEKQDEQITSPVRRPKIPMGMPGMGFGGNVLAEMKLKKLGKKADEEGNESQETNKTSSSSSGDKNSPNANENNNNNSGTSPSAISFLSRLKGKPDKDGGKSGSHSTEVKPLLPPSRGLPGKPPPLPTKPKPTLIKSLDGKGRPMSEFIAPALTESPLVRSRSTSSGKSTNKEAGGGK